MCEINCPNQATHLIHSADRSGLSLQACAAHVDQAAATVAVMANDGVEIVTAPL